MGAPNALRDRDLRSITADGVFFSAMVGLGETYLPAFVLAAGLGEVAAGLVATLPILAGAVFQLVTPWAVRRLRSYRRWVVLCAGLQALTFTPLIAGAWRGEIGLGWVAVSTVAYWSFGMATSPAWNAWVTRLVPPELRAGFFARRTRAAHIALFAAVGVGGLVLERGGARGSDLTPFAALFALALLARLVSARFLARQSEGNGAAAEHRTLSPREILAAVREADSGRVLTYLVLMQAMAYVAVPFFTPYMLGPLGLSYAEFMALTATAFATRIAVLPLLGELAERRGTRFVLGCGALGIAPLPVLWLASHHFAYLLALQAVAGVAWAAVEFATLLSFFEGIPERDRTSVLTAYNLANALAISCGALLGSVIFDALEGSSGAYAALFALSTAGRLAALCVLPGMVVASRILELRLRTLAVRPSTGAVERPILASLETPEPEAPGSAPSGQDVAEGGRLGR